MGMGIKRLFKKIGSFDLFAANTPSLNLKGQSKLSTCSGILFSIGMWLFLLAMLVFLSRSLTDRSSPSFYNFEEPTTVSDTNTYLFSSKGFQMGFGMINTASQLPYTNSSIFSIQAYLHVGPSVTGDQYWEDRLLDIEPCTAAHFDGNFSQYQDLWCIKEEQAFGNVFVKSYDDAWFEIRFLPCQPGMTPGVECAPDDEINSTLQASTWIAWYPEYMINPLVYSNPMSQDYTSIPRPVTLDVEKQVLMSVKVIDFNSDNGVLVSSPDVSKVLTIKEVDDGTETQSGTKAFLTASIVNSGIIFHYNRTYTKLGDILGQIFGLAGLIMPLLGLVLLPWSSSKIYQHMINQVYEVRDDGLDKSGKKGRPRKRSQRSSQRNGRQDNKAKKRVENKPQIYVKSPSNGDYMKYGYDEEFGGNGVIHQQMDQDKLNGLGITMTVSADIEKQHLSDPLLNEMSREDYRGDNYLNSPIVIDPKSRSLGSDHFKNSQERKASNFLTKSILSKLIPKETHEESFQLTFGQWVKSLFKSHPKSNIFNKGKESLLEQIDVLTIIRKLNEIDNLKACLLSRDQRVLFDNLPKPILELKDDEAALNGVVHRRGYAQSYRGEQTQAWDVYSRIKRSEERSEVDEKLLSIFERKEELY